MKTAIPLATPVSYTHLKFSAAYFTLFAKLFASVLSSSQIITGYFNIFSLLYKTWKYVEEYVFSTYQKDIFSLSLFHLLLSSLVF